MTDWNEKLNLAASELESAREKRDDLIKETEAAIIRYQVEIETLFTELDVEKLLNDMNKVLFSGSGSLQVQNPGKIQVQQIQKKAKKTKKRCRIQTS